MKIYLISQKKNSGYDTFDSAVVIAENEEQARNLDPSGNGDARDWDPVYNFRDWASSPSQVVVKYLGETELPKQVVCASFNAG